MKQSGDRRGSFLQTQKRSVFWIVKILFPSGQICFTMVRTNFFEFSFFFYFTAVSRVFTKSFSLYVFRVTNIELLIIFSSIYYKKKKMKNAFYFKCAKYVCLFFCFFLYIIVCFPRFVYINIFFSNVAIFSNVIHLNFIQAFCEYYNWPFRSVI